MCMILVSPQPAGLTRVLTHCGTAAAGRLSREAGDLMYEMISYRDYVEMYDKEGSRRVISYRLKFSFSAIYPDSSLVELGDFERVSKRYVRELRKGERDVYQDALTIIAKAEDLASLTLKGVIHTFLNWLAMNDYSLPYSKRKRLLSRFTGVTPITEEMELDRKMIQRICSVLPEWCQSLAIVLAGSGMRIGEATSFEIKDIDLSVSPARIYLKASYTKNKKARMVLITEEAKQEVIKMIGDRTAGQVFLKNQNTFNYHWIRAMRTLNIPKSHFVDRYMIHPHMLRKWFLSEFSLVASRDIAEMLAGHSGYLSDSYRRYSTKTIVSEFLKAESAITVFPGIEKLDASAAFEAAEA